MAAKYFRVVGIFLLIDWIVGLIFYIIYMTGEIQLLVKSSSSESTLGISLLVFGLVSIVFFGPAVGLLFISHASEIDRGAYHNSSSNFTYQPYVRDLHKEDKISSISIATSQTFRSGQVVHLKESITINDKNYEEGMAFSVERSDKLTTKVIFRDENDELISIDIPTSKLK